MSEPGKKRGIRPVMIVAAIALACVFAIVFLVRDRWNSPEVKSVEQARTSGTGQAAQEAGATLLPTDPKLTVEPKPAGPKQAQPAIPN
jgi:hypothetical protein